MESEQSNIIAVCDTVDSVKNATGIELLGDSTGSSEIGTFVQTPEKDLWATQSGSEDVFSEDQFEGIFYSTQVNASVTKLRFVSHVFFSGFYKKILADFSENIKINETNKVAKCFTHVRGLKCEICVDIKSYSLTISGVGHRLWRKEYFPKVALLLFKRYVYEADSQFGAEDEYQQNVAQSQTEPSEMETFHLNADNPVFTSTPIIQRPGDSQNSRNSSAQNSTSTECLLGIFNMLRDVESEMKTIKENVITVMESKINELKTHIVSLFDKAHGDKSYRDAVRENPSVISRADDEGFCNSTLSNTSQTQLKTVFQTENHSTSQRQISATQPSQPKTDEQRPPRAKQMQVNGTDTVGQKVPVIISNRNLPTTNAALGSTTASQDNGSTSYGHHRIPLSSEGPNAGKKTLLIGDSLLHGINTKGLVKHVQKHSKGGATVKALSEEIVVYDLTVFNKIIIYVGGNDCAQKIDQTEFEDDYDKLLSLINTSNQECEVYLCYIAPRGDIDVSVFNDSIKRVATYWEEQNVNFIPTTYDFFFGNNNLPATRYYSTDSIHLSQSGLKRLLNAIDISVRLVENYDLCTFRSPVHRSNGWKILDGNQGSLNRGYDGKSGGAENQNGSRQGGEFFKNGSQLGSAENQNGRRRGEVWNQNGGQQSGAGKQNGNRLGGAENQNGSRPGGMWNPNGNRLGGAWNPIGRRPGGVRNQNGSRPGVAWNQNGRRPGGTWNQNGIRPGGTWNPNGRRPGGTWNSNGRRPGGVWNPNGSRPDGAWNHNGGGRIDFSRGNYAGKFCDGCQMTGHFLSECWHTD